MCFVIECSLFLQIYLEKRAAERGEGSTDVLIVCSSALAGGELTEADGLVREGKATCMSLSTPSLSRFSLKLQLCSECLQLYFS